MLWSLCNTQLSEFHQSFMGTKGNQLITHISLITGDFLYKSVAIASALLYRSTYVIDIMFSLSKSYTGETAVLLAIDVY